MVTRSSSATATRRTPLTCVWMPRTLSHSRPSKVVVPLRCAYSGSSVSLLSCGMTSIETGSACIRVRLAGAIEPYSSIACSRARAIAAAEAS